MYTIFSLEMSAIASIKAAAFSNAVMVLETVCKETLQAAAISL